MSRVVHLRIDEADILGCFEILDNAGAWTPGQPVATVVTRSLNALLASLRDSGQLSTPQSFDETLRKLEKYMPRDPSISLGVRLDDVMAQLEDDKLDSEIESSEDHEAAWVAALEAQLQESGARMHEAPREPEPNQPDTERKPIWENQDRLPFDQLMRDAPKDRIIEHIALQKERGRSMWQQEIAVGIVYKNIPRALWGTSRAEEFVNDILKHIELDINDFGEPAL